MVLDSFFAFVDQLVLMLFITNFLHQWLATYSTNHAIHTPPTIPTMPSNFSTTFYEELGAKTQQIVALTSTGIHLVWKWPKSNSKSEGFKGSAPQLWRPKNGLLMTNIMSHKPDTTEPCFALTKNDSYIISASGGEFSLFNVLTFERLANFLPSAPGTAVALYPKDNNVIAIGGEGFTIVIYNIRANEIKHELKGHSKCIADLAFSMTLNKLISFGADAKIVAWDSERWEEQGSTSLPISDWG